jgi:hypothetical protein
MEKKERKESVELIEESGGGLSETGQSEEGRVDSHGPVLFSTFLCPVSTLSLCAHALGPKALWVWLFLPHSLFSK